MSTVDRWGQIAGLLNEATDQNQQDKKEVLTESTINSDQLRKMISEIASEMLSEGLIDDIKKGDDMGKVFDPAALWSPVKQMQWGLGLLGYLDPNSFSDIDGNFGPKTKKALERFQKQNKLKPDGVWGPKTNAAFVKAVKGQISSGADMGFGEITDPSPGPSNLGTVNATKQWLESWLEYSDLDGKVIRMGGSAKRSKPARQEPEAPVKKRKALTVADAEEPSKAEADTIDDFLDGLGEDPTDEEIRAAEEATAYARLQKVGAGDPGDEEDLDMTMSALLPGVTGYGADAWTRGVEVTDKSSGQTTVVISQQDWEAAGGPNLPDDVQVAEDPNLGK